MVKNIQLLDTSQRLFDLNVELFQSKYPEIFSKFTLENEDEFSGGDGDLSFGLILETGDPFSILLCYYAVYV